MAGFPTNINKNHLLQAIAEIDEKGVPPRGRSSMYDLVHNGNRYPPKLVVSIANKYANGEELDRDTFHGGMGTPAFNLIAECGFTIEFKESAFDKAYAEMCERFHIAYPNFSNLSDDFRFLQSERNYKIELVEHFQSVIMPLLNKQQWAEAGVALKEILTKKLPNNDAPQNIVGWRYTETVYKMPPDILQSFAQLVGFLVDEEYPLHERIEKFRQFFQDRPSDDQLTPAALRSHIGFYLTLAHPDKYIFIKTQELNRILRRFVPNFSWEKSCLQAQEVELVGDLAARILAKLKEDGWQPQDLMDVQSFLWVAESAQEGNQKAPDNDAESNQIQEPQPEDAGLMSSSLNKILYGPPGTGKTYHTVNEALKVVDPDFLAQNADNRPALTAHFQKLQREGIIGFVTFHQSFSYEDFVEGLKADASDGQIRYYVDDGVFKRMCTLAEADSNVIEGETVDIAGKTIWKMSLGNTLADESNIYDHCIDNGEIRLGYGNDLDFSSDPGRKQIVERLAESGRELEENSYEPTAVDIFKNKMAVGDLVIVSDGNTRFRAIGEIVGDYLLDAREDMVDYGQVRKVKWLRVYENSQPYEELMNKKFSQMTVYKFSDRSISKEKLAGLLGASAGVHTSDGATKIKHRVLIIDEINRGNVSSIFGELITLIEADKRAGAAEALSVKLPYSKQMFSVPANLHIIGTMNTADRSLALIDTALRRRFDFIEMMPKPSLLADIVIKGIDIEALLRCMNDRIEALYDREHTLGHAFFVPLLSVDNEDLAFQTLESIFRNKILPLLEEYFFEDWEKIRLVLGDQNKPAEYQFVREKQEFSPRALFGAFDAQDMLDERATCYERNNNSLDPEAYKLIYAPR